MPLVLSLRVGQDFFVGNEQVTVTKITGYSKFDVRVTSSGRTYHVNDEEAVELHELSDVYLSAGDRPQAGLARVAIDAPREIPILRGDAARSPRVDDGEAEVFVDNRKRNRWA
jgi:sRNA-binding carbon storage regulator CsrA